MIPEINDDMKIRFTKLKAMTSTSNTNAHLLPLMMDFNARNVDSFRLPRKM
jgi:hypothetical protein